MSIALEVITALSVVILVLLVAWRILELIHELAYRILDAFFRFKAKLESKE